MHSMCRKNIRLYSIYSLPVMVLLLDMFLSSNVMLWCAANGLIVANWFYPRHTVTKQYVLSAKLFKQHNRCPTTIWTFREWVTRPSWALEHFNEWYDFAEIRDWQFNCVYLQHLTALFAFLHCPRCLCCALFVYVSVLYVRDFIIIIIIIIIANCISYVLV